MDPGSMIDFKQTNMKDYHYDSRNIFCIMQIFKSY